MDNGQLKPAYNLQIAVNSEYITGLVVFSNRTDFRTLVPLLQKMKKEHGCHYMDEAGKESPADPSFRNSHSLTKNRRSCPVQMLSFSAVSALLYPKSRKTKSFPQGEWQNTWSENEKGLPQNLHSATDLFSLYNAFSAQLTSYAVFIYWATV